MNAQEVKSILKIIFQQIAPEIDFEKIDATRPLRDQVEIDSFDFYRILLQLQEKTSVFVPDSKVPELKNLEELMSYIIAQSTPHQPQSPGL
jgi:acyl carrier protein